MALGFYFSPAGFTTEKYDTVMTKLEEAGAAAPAGRLHHIAFASGDGVHVFDVWESQEAFEAFGATLMPILTAAGVDPGQPHVSQVHNVVNA